MKKPTRLKKEVHARLRQMGKTATILSEDGRYTIQTWQVKLENPTKMTIGDCRYLANFLELSFETIIEWCYN